MTNYTRRGFLATAGVTALAGCLGGDGDRETQAGTHSVRTDAPGTATDGGGASRESLQAVPTIGEQLPLPRSPEALRDAARSGGPPKDGIPSIDEPRFVDAAGVDFLDAGDPVFGVVRDGTAKAYPQKILAQHEIVNDTLAGDPVAVTYCPLTGTVQGFERGETTFGVSGRLINNNLVMYDRATETWWPQILATAIPGPWNESPPIVSLKEFRLIWTTWEDWRENHPDTEVLSTETGHARNYENDPYGTYNPRGGYYDNDSTLFPVLVERDRFEKKRVVMGARTPDGAAAFLKDSLRSETSMTGTVGEAPVVAIYDPRYETAYVYHNPDEQAFASAADDGHQIEGPDESMHDPDALPLERIHTFDAMWFAWAGYYPETNVYE